MSDLIPTLTPGENYWDRIGITRGPHADQSDDFSTLLPKPDPGERLPDTVMVPGAIVTPPKQAQRYASRAAADVQKLAAPSLVRMDAMEAVVEAADRLAGVWENAKEYGSNITTLLTVHNDSLLNAVRAWRDAS